MCLDPAVLPTMAAQGSVLTPTLGAIESGLPRARSAEPSPRRDWYLGGAEVHGRLAATAVEAGVTVLAGTDSRPHGRIVDEIRALAAAGLSSHNALAAASWSARTWLGLGGLTPDSPADAVVYPRDPRTDLSVLDQPSAVILRGRRVR